MGYIVFGNGRFPPAAIALFVIMGLSCAKQGLPPGGKEDENPPRLVGSTPAHMTVNVSVTEPVTFEFFEPMDNESVEDNFFIVPIPPSWPEFSWRSGNSVLTVKLKEPLKDNTTYIVTIGAKARDMRRNQLEDTITLTFSTGESIENGKITGRVIPYSYFGKEPENISGVDVVAFRLDSPQTMPDPRNDVPDYFTQTGIDGSFEINGLSKAVYRIFAIGDRDGDGFYSEGSDMVGIAPHDVTLAQNDSVAVPSIMISEKDTTSVQLRSVRAPDSRRIELFFDKPVSPQGIKVDVRGLDIIGWFVDSKKIQMVSVATGIQETGRQYTVETLSVFDIDGNTMAPFDFSSDFQGTENPDTTALEIVEWGPKILVPGNEPVRLIFNRMLALTESPETRFALADTSGEDLTITRTAHNELEISPDDGWNEGYNYTVLLDGELIQGIAGNRLPDSENVILFRAVRSDTLGFMQGAVVDSGGTVGSMYRILFKHLETYSIRGIEVKGASEWYSGGVLPGQYILLAYRDDDGDSTVFRGSVHPYRASEQVVVYPDTVTVNPRWTVEDIRFIFR